VLATGLRLWRGSAFDSVPDTLTVRAFATRLNEARLAAHELLAATKCSLGSCGEVVPGLTGLAAAHPYRESLHRLLMFALYQAGRPLEALDVFARFRTRLAADYGVDPHPESSRLHQDILRGAVEFARLPEHRELSGAR
jgi:DNA-binding SARP family transcriptional activator